MGLIHQEPAQQLLPFALEARFNAGQRQRPGRAPALVEHRRAHPPAAFQHQARIHRIAGLPRLRQVLPDQRLGVRRREVAGVRGPAGQQLLLLRLGQERHDGGAGGGHPERETDSLVQHKGPHREAALLPEQAHRFRAAPDGEERAFAGLLGEPAKAGPGDVLQRETRRGHGSHQQDLRAQHPVAARGSWSSSPSAASEDSSRCTVGRVSPDSLTSSTSGEPSGLRPTMRSRDATRLTTCAPWTGGDVIFSSKSARNQLNHPYCGQCTAYRPHCKNGSYFCQILPLTASFSAP